jgi:zinc transporter ZupT
MSLLYNLLLLIITFIGGSAPLWVKSINERNMHYLLTFSGSFLLCVTFLHILPEAFSESGNRAGIYIVVGFFLQMLIQRLTHGLEHGHTHIDNHGHHVPVLPILVGMSIHAFMEGLPLGFHYLKPSTGPSLYYAVAAHKLPEAMIVTSLVYHVGGRSKALLFLLLFSCTTPAASMLASVLSDKTAALSQAANIILPIVAGAFIHIATTIFFESGTSKHVLSYKKVFAMLLGLGIALLTFIAE